MLSYPCKQRLLQLHFSSEDRELIWRCRGPHNRLGFAYQMTFVRLLNRFPDQTPLEVIEDIVTFVGDQLNINQTEIIRYGNRQPTIAVHQETLRQYLSLRPFKTALSEVEEFLFKECQHLEQTSALMARLKEFLSQEKILEPAQDTLTRIIHTKREASRTAIYSKVSSSLSHKIKQNLDDLLIGDDGPYSPLHYLKKPPGNPSPTSFIKLTEILDRIKETEILSLNMSWLSNNFQRSLARYVRQCSSYRLRRLKEERRHTMLICFLNQLYQDTFDAAIQMHDKLMNKMYNKADKEINDNMRSRLKYIRSSLTHYKEILGILLDEEGVTQKQVREAIFKVRHKEDLEAEQQELEDILGNKYSDRFKRVIARHSYLRQFSPALVKHLSFQADTQDEKSKELIKAVELLHHMNEQGKHKLPKEVPTHFIPKKFHPFIFQNEKPVKPAWECALLTVLRDQIKSGNICVPNSKRFASLNTFFIPEADWNLRQESFFKRAGLPANPKEVVPYLTNRLNQAYDQFLEKLPENNYAQLNDKGWKISSDPMEKLEDGTDKNLNPLKDWIGQHIRTIKLPELLIEVDNELKFSHVFMTERDQECPGARHIWASLRKSAGNYVKDFCVSIYKIR